MHQAERQRRSGETLRDPGPLRSPQASARTGRPSPSALSEAPNGGASGRPPCLPTRSRSTRYPAMQQRLKRVSDIYRSSWRHGLIVSLLGQLRKSLHDPLSGRLELAPEPLGRHVTAKQLLDQEPTAARPNPAHGARPGQCPEPHRPRKPPYAESPVCLWFGSSRETASWSRPKADV